MIEIEVKYDDDALRKEIDRLFRAGGDLSPVMIEIAGHLQDSVAESFQRQAAPPDGEAWKPLAETTVEERRRTNYGPEEPILQRDGGLLRSILPYSDDDSAVAESNLIYAATHQFGDEKRGIPARPFLGLWPEHHDAIRGHLRR